ncbi:hypothetical protein [Lysinibacillus xylanilyticus]|uniref:hypothetical protein n=1 Tax=Lysinibacillus xylanilyticus TaxID=582475 RepID=UPI003D042E1F
MTYLKAFAPVAMLSGQKNIFASVAALSMQKKYVKNFDVFKSFCPCRCAFGAEKHKANKICLMFFVTI